MAKVNRAIFARVLFVSQYGRPEHRNGALARLALMKDALIADRRFPSDQPVLPAVETECWTWWHQVDAESARAIAAAS
ncbi:MAG TPA: hypothetical protein VEA41_16420 [Salinarimonas sp.]|jgi:hypothetical protein|nr:hypothetical protein [Salinarimonas sp.]